MYVGVRMRVTVISDQSRSVRDGCQACESTSPSWTLENGWVRLSVENKSIHNMSHRPILRR
jgi:hypothetical protein